MGGAGYPLSKNTPALGPSGLDTSSFPDLTILAPKPKSQTAYVPKDAMLSSPELVPHFLNQRYAPVYKILFNELYVMPLCPLHSLPKTPEMSNALHFAKSFVDTQVRIVFDQYLTGSLTETTRQKRTIKTTPVH